MSNTSAPAYGTMSFAATHPPGSWTKRDEVVTWSSSIVIVLGLFGFHAALGLAMHRWPVVATAHGWAIGVIALAVALRASRAKVAMLGAYIAGAEVLWRMSGALVPWEYGKYITIVAFVITLCRRRGEFRWRIMPLVFFFLLIPSVLVLLNDPTWDLAAIKDEVSFALSGPLALAIAVWFFSQVDLSPGNVRDLFVLCAAPIIGVAAITLVSTYSGTAIQWTGESNFVTSGGFGPNQTSAALGLGALLVFLVSIDQDTPPAARWIMTGSALLFLTQAAMTFSRGGVYAAAAAAALGSITIMVGRRGQTRGNMRSILVLALLTLALTAAVLPRLDQFTEGALNARLRETTLTGRDQLIRDDLRLWSENPVLGVGPGGVVRHRSGRAALGHTEYSELLAEHGLFGALALVVLLMMCTRRVLRTRDPRERALVIALLSWSLLTMAHAAMRLVAPCLILGLAFAAFTQPNCMAVSVHNRQAE